MRTAEETDARAGVQPWDQHVPRWSLGGIDPAGTLTLHFWSPEPSEEGFLLF